MAFLFSVCNGESTTMTVKQELLNEKSKRRSTCCYSKKLELFLKSIHPLKINTSTSSNNTVLRHVNSMENLFFVEDSLHNKQAAKVVVATNAQWMISQVQRKAKITIMITDFLLTCKSRLIQDYTCAKMQFMPTNILSLLGRKFPRLLSGLIG